MSSQGRAAHRWVPAGDIARVVTLGAVRALLSERLVRLGGGGVEGGFGGGGAEVDGLHGVRHGLGGVFPAGDGGGELGVGQEADEDLEAGVFGEGGISGSRSTGLAPVVSVF